MKSMHFSECLFLIKSDFYRVHRKMNFSLFLKEFLFGIGLKFCIWMRLLSFIRSRHILKYCFGPGCFIIFRHLQFKFGIDISSGTKIGAGFYIGHFGGIVVSSQAVIGRNCNISQNVTIGKKEGGAHPGYPVIGNNVYIGPGAKIIGGVTVGDGCVIGANAVITHDCPPKSVMAGVPAVVIGVADQLPYVMNTEY